MRRSPSDADFDDLAHDYDRFRTGYSGELYDTLAGFGFTPGKHVLDVACGTGLASAAFAARGLTVTGIDPSAQMLEAARRRVPAGTFVEGRAEALPFGDGGFDAAASAQSFHWFEQPAALREMIRVVRPGAPVAVWWKLLAADDDVRRFRAAACEEAGVPPGGDILAGGFRAFYGAPFASRELRVIPYSVRVTVDEWLGYERSRAKTRAYGDRRAAYFATLERRLRDVFRSSGTRFEVRYVQYVYVGLRG